MEEPSAEFYAGRSGSLSQDLEALEGLGWSARAPEGGSPRVWRPTFRPGRRPETAASKRARRASKRQNRRK